jgi:hypothetical protein
MNILTVTALALEGSVLLLAALGLLLTLLALTLVISMGFARQRVERERASDATTKAAKSSAIADPARF